jgi:hypothetical protein
MWLILDWVPVRPVPTRVCVCIGFFFTGFGGLLVSPAGLCARVPVLVRSNLNLRASVGSLPRSS